MCSHAGSLVTYAADSAGLIDRHKLMAVSPQKTLTLEIALNIKHMLCVTNPLGVHFLQ